MANLIQIKRSLTTATAPSLANGELAFTANGDHLFIGSNAVSITIGGKYNPGVLTANQALVANGTGYLDAVKADALTVRTITANGVTSPGAGYILSVDGGGNTYWLPQSSVSINTAAQFSWTNTHSFAANVNVTGAQLNAVSFTVGSNFIANTTKLTFTGANVDFGSSTAKFGNTTITGDLTVTGTVTTVDTTNLTVTDPLIRLAQGQAATSTYTDSVDIGVYGVYGNTASTKYTGLARDSATGNWVLFKDQTTNPDNTAVDSTNAVATPLATLITYLNAGGLVANSTVVNVTANSTVSVALTANTLSLSTPLAVTSGGLGLATITAGAILVGNGTGTATVLAAGTNGYVLQSNGTSVVYSTLDGGTF